MFRGDEAAAVVAFFGPWIWVEQEGSANALFWQNVEQIARVAGVNSDICDPCSADFTQEHGHAVDVGLAADKADIRVQSGLMQQMLAAAKTNFEPHRRIAKECL